MLKIFFTKKIVTGDLSLIRSGHAMHYQTFQSEIYPRGVCSLSYMRLNLRLLERDKTDS